MLYCVALFCIAIHCIALYYVVLNRITLHSIVLHCVIYLFVCVEVLRPSQPNGFMSSTVSLPNHTFTGQA